MSDPALAELLKALREKEQSVDAGGGHARQARQKRLGRLNARERLSLLVDAGSFEELGRYTKSRHTESPRIAATHAAGDGIICGLATIDQRTVAVYAHDPTVLRGTLGKAGADNLCRLLDLAFEKKLPVIALVDCEGVRVEEGVDALNGVAGVISRTIRLRGHVPQLTLVCGLAVGVAAYTAVLTDAVAMVHGQSFMFVTGGKVTEVVTGERSDIDELGGPLMHARVSGACHEIVSDERAGFTWLKTLLGVTRGSAHAGRAPLGDIREMDALIPAEPRRAYDVRKVLTTLADAGSVLELKSIYAPNLVTAFARLGGRPVGVVASQTMQLAGCLDVKASKKGAAFVKWVSALGLPLVTLVDVPGYLPGKAQEEDGILSEGAELLIAYAESRVPKVAVVLRKSYGGASVLSFAADVRLALPFARVDTMGADASFEVVFGPEFEGATPAQQAERTAAKKQWSESRDSVWASAEQGYLDAIVEPAQLRTRLCRVLDRLTGGTS